MYQVDFNKPKKVFFIGIGGISMSGLAEILLDRGFTVSGSDNNTSDIIEKLVAKAAVIYRGHHENHIDDSYDFVVYTAAIKPDNCEYIKTISLNIPIMDRASLLGQIMNHYKNSVGVAGTHGKTTTTSMVAHVFEQCKLDSTISVGGILDLIDGNIKVGSSDYFVTESCEYANSFHKFKPYIAIILNIEEDHMDFFKDLDEIRQSFLTFMQGIHENGYAIINDAILEETHLYDDINANIITYGLKPTNDYYAKEIHYNDFGCGSYDLYNKDQKLVHVDLRTTGEHNVLNSVATLAMAHIMKLNMEIAALGIHQFSGTKRRFEYKGNLSGITIIDDYAHHPTEIEATIKAARRIVKNKLWIVFQPHTYTRMTAFVDEFAITLSKADGIIVADIYAAREIDHKVIHSKDLCKKIMEFNDNVIYIPDFDEIENYILTHCVPSDMLITMGAGNIHLIGDDLLKA